MRRVGPVRGVDPIGPYVVCLSATVVAPLRDTDGSTFSQKKLLWQGPKSNPQITRNTSILLI